MGRKGKGRGRKSAGGETSSEKAQEDFGRGKVRDQHYGKCGREGK